jgi:hypothetical protein
MSNRIIQNEIITNGMANEIKGIRLLPDDLGDEMGVKLQFIYSVSTSSLYDSDEDELSFFYKLNHLLYILEKKNIQDIIHLRGINGDIYNVLNYLFVKYKKNNAIRKKIIQFINVNFYLPRG